ncbi:MAG: prephenate dehydratase [Deltaproteobacteria bacterium]|nr:prephenate dehydratase [Deltaproteobacteria bacterium]
MNPGETRERAWRRLEAFRGEIDRIDDRILSLLSRRRAAAVGIGMLKRSLQLAAADPARERQILESLASRSREGLDPGAVRSIFSEIIAACRSVQEPPRVAFLGPDGTFTHQAALRLHGKEADYRPFRTLEEVFQQVADAHCDQGVVPLENTFEGTVHETLDLFSRYKLFIRAEVRLKIRHHLLSRSPEPESVQCLYSHPMALAQCRRWIRLRLPSVRIREVESTAGAVALASGDSRAGAVGGRLAGELYGVPALAEGIQDRGDNITRFAALGRDPGGAGPSGRDRTSVLLALAHRPAALFRALAPLAERGVNLTRIDSRPRRNASWEYLFFLDMEGHASDEPLAAALGEIKHQCLEMKVLGSYPGEEDPCP